MLAPCKHVAIPNHKRVHQSAQNQYTTIQLEDCKFQVKMPPNPQLVEDIMQARDTRLDNLSNSSGSKNKDLRARVTGLKEQLLRLEERMTKLKQLMDGNSAKGHSIPVNGTSSGGDKDVDSTEIGVGNSHAISNTGAYC
ncbi:uncharacterized protein N0V89_007244 [Didymosphaeria variabile]|uniref:Uncharacterized protein n=1 Tax=Didymosphaeria variabile TaxID=1932322 RepID=A0A9W8XIH5_9PLEO|nr:uncharacterized protein N0V89_007244 [Didymosphaeria variabile]KAJ4351900.1 hypothetical protein N0V89_007244 [Didymosphaeria variabile]